MMIKQTLNVFKLKFSILKNRILRATAMDGMKFAILFVFILFYCWGGQRALVIFFAKLREMPNLAEMMISKLWVSQIVLLMFSAFAPFLVFGGIVSFVPTFFNRKELTFNMVNNRSLFPLFAYNYFEVVFKNFAFILIAVSPLLIAYGRLFDASYGYFLSAPVIVFVFAAVLVSAGILVSLLIMGAVPGSKAVPAINLATMLASVFLIYYLVLTNPVNIIGGDFVNQLLKYARQLREPSSSLNVSVMTNLVLTGIVYQKPGLIASNGFKLLAAAAAAAGANLWLGYRIFSKKVVAATEESGTGVFSTLNLFSRHGSAVAGVFKKYPLAFKEVIYLFRDTTILLQLLTILVLAAAFVINIAKVSRLDAESAIFYVRLSYPAAVLLLVIFAGRLVFPSVSSEGRNIWLMKLSPFGMRRFVFTKFMLLFAMQFAFSMVFLMAINLLCGFPRAAHVVFNFSFLVSAVMTTAGFTLGTLLADFSESDPWKIATGLGGVLFFIVSFSFSLFPILLAVLSYGRSGYRMAVVNFSFILSAASVFAVYLILSRLVRRLELKEV